MLFPWRGSRMSGAWYGCDGSCGVLRRQQRGSAMAYVDRDAQAATGGAQAAAGASWGWAGPRLGCSGVAGRGGDLWGFWFWFQLLFWFCCWGWWGCDPDEVCGRGLAARRGVWGVWAGAQGGPVVRGSQAAGGLGSEPLSSGDQGAGIDDQYD
ncbi:hypothetical protein SSP35_09_00030 [Streptomyces sp. NBRC 110611]|nr:hypothetical protein SSP35_09_00030 [Streptomyces sp. NBRC 110611]